MKKTLIDLFIAWLLRTSHTNVQIAHGDGNVQTGGNIVNNRKTG